jgi:hypothetical protein
VEVWERPDAWAANFLTNGPVMRNLQKPKLMGSPTFGPHCGAEGSVVVVENIRELI